MREASDDVGFGVFSLCVFPTLHFCCCTDESLHADLALCIIYTQQNKFNIFEPTHSNSDTKLLGRISLVRNEIMFKVMLILKESILRFDHISKI